MQQLTNTPVNLHHLRQLQSAVVMVVPAMCYE